MTDPLTMSFSLNQTVLNAAIAAELPRLLKDLQFDYTSGRAPKGLTAQVTLTEAMIRQAVTAYARRTVNTTFTHLSIQFQATRGEEGMTANITASTAPIEPEAEAPVATRATAVSNEPETTTASSEAAEVEAATMADVITTEAEAEGVADVAQDTGVGAPFEADTAATAPADAPAVAVAVSEAPKVRSKLFGDLKRPDNSVSE
jgi:rubrerythrin